MPSSRTTSKPRVESASADQPHSPKLLVAISFTVVVLIWGSTWIAIKFAVRDMPPLTASGLRFIVAAPVFVIACRAFRTPLRYPAGMGWFFVFMVGCYFTVPFFLFNYGELYVSSGLASICVSSVSILMIIFSVPILHTRITRTQLAAVLIAFSALGTLITYSQGVGATRIWGGVALLGAAVIHSLAYIMIKRHGRTMHTLTLNTLPMVVGGLVLTTLGLIIERPGRDAFTAQSISATLYLGMVASVVGFGVYFWLIQRMDTVTVSFAFVLFPIIAQILAVVLEGTTFDWIDVLLTAVILSAFGITQLKQRAVTAPTPLLDASGHPTSSALAEVYKYVTAAYPAEACGFIRSHEIVNCVNVIEQLAQDHPEIYARERRTGYAFGPADLLALEEMLDSDDPVGIIYHSHPDAGAYFSDEDHRYAVYDGEPVYPVRHLVVDATQSGALGSRLFEFNTEQGRYTPVATFGEPRDRVLPPHAIRAKQD